MAQVEHAMYVRIALLSRGEIADLLGAIGVETEGVSEDQLRDTLTAKIEDGEVVLLD